MKKLKLTSLSSEVLNGKETKKVIGGNCCGCGCVSGGSGDNANTNANYDGNKWSPGGAKWIKCDWIEARNR